MQFAIEFRAIINPKAIWSKSPATIVWAKRSVLSAIQMIPSAIWRNWLRHKRAPNMTKLYWRNGTQSTRIRFVCPIVSDLILIQDCIAFEGRTNTFTNINIYCHFIIYFYRWNPRRHESRIVLSIRWTRLFTTSDSQTLNGYSSEQFFWYIILTFWWQWYE